MIYSRKIIKQWLYGKCPGFSGAFPYFGTKVYFPKDSLIFRLACEQGIYEQDNLDILSLLVRPNSTYFDIGANIGLMSIPILQRNDSCMVVSFEPSPNTLRFLSRTVESSNFFERWKIVGKAVGSQVGTLGFFMASPDMGAFDGFKDTRRANTDRQIEVPVTTIDVEWEALGRPAVSVIKIDIEGAELEALKGASKCLEKEKPYILLEWNATNLKAYNCSIDNLLVFAEQQQYLICSLPNLIPIFEPELLKLQMFKTETFLLFPNHKPSLV